ncbi:hypothetical protein [Rhabdothermincola sediminis]|uniref:hypothetical protein n=1 Tax=Rhabdothermincola sediminis TaxID=2751370 RepID=UPI001AA05F95|nr:hypothetical protein [Rhabdothermincola sediminis]
MAAWSSPDRPPRPQVGYEAFANVGANRLTTLLLAVGLFGMLTVSVGPMLFGDRAAIRDTIEAVEMGTLTYELHPSDRSQNPTIGAEECDVGWLNPVGVIRWSGAASASRSVTPRGGLTLPVPAYDVSAGMLRRLGVAPGSDEVLVGAAYAEEAGLRSGSVLLIDDRERYARVVPLPGELHAYQRAVLVPSTEFRATTCVVGLDPAVWRAPDRSLDATVPMAISDWLRRCVACDQVRISDAVRAAARRADFWPIGVVGAALLGVLYVILRRSDLAVYRLVGFGRAGTATVAGLEAFVIGAWSAAVAAVAFAGVLDRPPPVPRELAIRYVLIGACIVAAWVSGVALGAMAISERRVIAALRG